MILPSKQLPTDRSLLLVGAEVLIALHEPKTISRVWTDLRADRANRLGANPLTYKRFLIDSETGELVAMKLREIANQ